MTRREHLIGWAVALTIVLAPGLAEALGSWIAGPTP